MWVELMCHPLSAHPFIPGRVSVMSGPLSPSASHTSLLSPLGNKGAEVFHTPGARGAWD